MSEVKQVCAALVKAQRAFGPALKTSSNPHFRSRYADLSACVEAVIDALNENGIALIQRNIPCESGITIETVFVHESGEMLSSGPLHVPASKNDAQGYGSAQTYARRYSLMAACGIAPEDDDGNAASKLTPKTAEKKAKSTAQEVADITPISDEMAEMVANLGADLVSAFDDGRELEVLSIWRGITDNDIKVHLWAALAKESKLRSFIRANKQESTK